MWSGGIIDTHDGHDIVNVIFQFRHLNRIIARLDMFSSFKRLTLKRMGEFYYECNLGHWEFPYS
jgi:hypothetical protein